MDKERFIELFPELEEDKKERKEHKRSKWENGEKERDEKIGQEQRKREEFFDHMKMQIRPEMSWNLSESLQQKEWKNRKEKKRILIYSATAAACLIFMIIFPNLSELLKMSEQNNTILISENSLDENSEKNLTPDIKDQKEENSVSENIIDDDIDRDDVLDHDIKNEDKLNSNISENKAENKQESIVETDHQKEDYGRPETDAKETSKGDVNSKEKPKKEKDKKRDNKKENTKTDNSDNSNDTKTDNLDNNDTETDNQNNNGAEGIQESANTENTESSETYVISPDMPSTENDSGLDHIENIEETVNDDSANGTTIADSADSAEDTTVTDSAIEDNNTISITPTEDIGDIPDIDFDNALRGWWEKEQGTGTSTGNANYNQAGEETNIATEKEDILEGIENDHDITKEQIEKKLSKYPYLYYYQDGKKESWYQAEEKTQSSIEGKKFLGTALILKEKTLILDKYGNTQEIVYIYGEENDLSAVFVRFQADGEDWFYKYKQ